MDNDDLYRHAHELLERLAEVAAALASNLECSEPLGEAADRHELRELGHELDDAVGTFRELLRTAAAGEPLSESQHFFDLARLAGERDDLTSRLRHVRRHLDRVMTAAHDEDTSIAAIAQAAGLSRETVYQSIARYAMRDLPTTR